MRILFHILIWVFYLCLPLYIIPNSSELFSTNDLYFNIYLFVGLASIGFFYFNYKLTLPRYFQQSKYVIFILSNIAFLIGVISLTKFGVSELVPNLDASEYASIIMSSSYGLRFLLIFLVSIGVFFNDRLQQLKIEKINSELTSLKSQINPHFLFNTLNGIYGQAITNSDKTADSILKLSSIMRYVITETDVEKVSLEKEFKYIKDYIVLQQNRLSEKTKINLQIPSKSTDLELPPLLFINFIENAFKYGVSNEVETLITIRISVEGNLVSFYVKNDKPIRLHKIEESYKIGLANIKRRLNLLYGDNYILNVSENSNEYIVTLKLNLK